MFDILEKEILEHLPPYKSGNGGWLHFDAPCCIHNGESQDKRGRGNLIISGDGSISYNCYNCKFKTGWRYGNKFLGTKLKNFMSWIGISDNSIKSISFQLLKEFNDTDIAVKYIPRFKKLEFNGRELPSNSIKIIDAINDKKYENDPDLLMVIDYLYSRGERLFSIDNYYWCPDIKYNDMRKRVIIPFYWNNKMVGYTARLAYQSSNKKSMRYYSDLQSNYIFNTESIKENHRYIFLVEGPFDALAINGVSTLGDKCSNIQAEWLNHLARNGNKKIIVIPDQEKYGGELLKIAIKYEWMVSFPHWKNCKDAADATKKYGYIATVQSIFSRLMVSENQINQLKLQLLGNKNDR